MSTTNFKKLFISQGHPYHLVEPSPLPFLSGTTVALFLSMQALSFHGYEFFLKDVVTHVFGLLFIITVLVWFNSIVLESSSGFHTKLVQQGLRFGMLLFIASEVLFFFAFFWAFFHYTLSPSVTVGTVWPPVATQHLNILELPLTNTILLLLSGVTITASHNNLLENNKTLFSVFLAWTISLGVVFLICQGVEYKYGVNFSWRDSVHGSIFFITTGFHGLHVTLGTMLLSVCWLRHKLVTLIPLFFYTEESKAHFVGSRLDFTATHHFGFEAAAWYWHFVDVVWLFLFITVYWFGS